MRDELNRAIEQVIENKYLNQRVTINYSGRYTIILDPEGSYKVIKVVAELGVYHQRNQWREAFYEKNHYRFKLTIEDVETGDERIDIYVHDSNDL